MRIRNKKLMLYTITTLAIMAVIFIFSCQDASQSRELSNGFISTFVGQFLEKILPRIYFDDFGRDVRKYAHMFEYMCLGISSALMWKEILRERLLFAAVCAEVFCFLYSVSDEWHQTFVPGRSGQFSDVLVDGIGITVGVLLSLIVCRFIIKKKEKGCN